MQCSFRGFRARRRRLCVMGCPRKYSDGYRRGGTTYGSVFITGASTVGRKLLRHESRHADQYTFMGGAFSFRLVTSPRRASAEGDPVTASDGEPAFRDGGYKRPKGLQ